MSRVGLKPIAIPAGVEVKVDNNEVVVKGPKGELSIVADEKIQIVVEAQEITVSRVDETRESRSLHGLTRALIANMVEGVVNGYSKQLEIQGVGFRVASKGPRELEFNLGFSHSVPFSAPEGIEFNIPSQTQIEISGIDKQLVGQVAANIRKLKPPEPYKGKGIRYVGEHVRRKAGKSAK